MESNISLGPGIEMPIPLARALLDLLGDMAEDDDCSPDLVRRSRMLRTGMKIVLLSRPDIALKSETNAAGRG